MRYRAGLRAGLRAGRYVRRIVLARDRQRLAILWDMDLVAQPFGGESLAQRRLGGRAVVERLLGG